MLGIKVIAEKLKTGDARRKMLQPRVDFVAGGRSGRIVAHKDHGFIDFASCSIRLCRKVRSISNSSRAFSFCRRSRRQGGRTSSTTATWLLLCLLFLLLCLDCLDILLYLLSR